MTNCFLFPLCWSLWQRLHDLTHWGWVTHICVSNLAIIGSDNGLSPGRRQAITWTNVGILLIGHLGTNFSEMLIEIHTFSSQKIHLKMSSGIKNQNICIWKCWLILFPEIYQSQFSTSLANIHVTAYNDWCKTRVSLWPTIYHPYFYGLPIMGIWGETDQVLMWLYCIC